MSHGLQTWNEGIRRTSVTIVFYIHIVKVLEAGMSALLLILIIKSHPCRSSSITSIQ